MRTQHGGEHPSDRLSSGRVAGFEEALTLVEAQCEGERAIMRRAVIALGVVKLYAPAEELAGMDASYAQISAATRQARRVWREEQEAARRRAVQRLGELAPAAEAALDHEASEWLGLLAMALESGDYSGLAIQGRGGDERMTVERGALATEQARGVVRRHSARQVRTAIVALAQEYREACRQHEEIAAYVFRLNGEAAEVLLDEEERVWEAMEQRRAALFGALEELEMVEGAGRGGNG